MGEFGTQRIALRRSSPQRPANPPPDGPWYASSPKTSGASLSREVEVRLVASNEGLEAWRSSGWAAVRWLRGEQTLAGVAAAEGP